MISKRFFPGQGFSQKTNENTSHSSKNKFICSFLGESSAWQFAFEINWPLCTTEISHKFRKESKYLQILS